MTDNGDISLQELLDDQRGSLEAARDSRYLTPSKRATQGSVDPAEFDRDKRRPICIGYIRVSTGKQQWGLEAQRKSIVPYFDYRLSDSHDWFPKPGEFFVDTGKSAKSIPFCSRPAGKRADEMLAKGDSIVIAKGDRAFRNMRDQVLTIGDWIDRGIALHSASEGWNTGDSGGRLIAHIMGICAEQESQRISERLLDAHLVAREKGQPAVQAPMGWVWAGKKGHRYLSPHRGDRYVMAKIVEWKREGYSFDQITLWLDKQGVYRQYKPGMRKTGWHHPTVHRGYWMELLILWLEREGADFKDPAVVNLVRGAVSYYAKGVGNVILIRDDAFKAQLERANL